MSIQKSLREKCHTIKGLQMMMSTILIQTDSKTAEPIDISEKKSLILCTKLKKHHVRTHKHTGLLI